MTWHQFWQEPAISYGGVVFLLFSLWVVNLWDRANAEYGEKVRRYEETHPIWRGKDR